MFANLRPDIIVNSVYDVDCDLLSKRNIKAVMLDLDGTLASSRKARGSKKLLLWIEHLRKNGIRVIVISNNNDDRVRCFCKPYRVDYVSRAKKPLKGGFKKARAFLDGVSCSEIAVIGDQVYTDVWGGNRHGMLTIFVHSVDRDMLINRMRHILEKPFLRG